MRVRWMFILLLALGVLALKLFSATGEQAEELADSESVIGTKEAIILGFVEGVTEYLPISSTGHLLLTNRLLGLDSEAVPEGRTVSTREVADAYAIIIQIGAIFAVLFLYWEKVWQICLGFLGLNPLGRRLGVNLLVAFMPAAIFGLLLDDFIESRLFAPLPIAVALIFGGFLMLGIEKWRREQTIGDRNAVELHTLGVRQSLMIGILQCFAMWPGLSRSMITIVGGYIAGLNPVRSAEFSFLLGLITLSAASCYRMFTHGNDLLAQADTSSVLLGIFVAFVSAAIAIKWMVAYLTRHGLAIFAWYRFALGLAVILLLVI